MSLRLQGHLQGHGIFFPKGSLWETQHQPCLHASELRDSSRVMVRQMSKTCAREKDGKQKQVENRLADQDEQIQSEWGDLEDPCTSVWQAAPSTSKINPQLPHGQSLESEEKWQIQAEQSEKCNLKIVSSRNSLYGVAVALFMPKTLWKLHSSPALATWNSLHTDVVNRNTQCE